MQEWEYLELTLDLAKRTWRDSDGRRGKLRRGAAAPALNEVGLEGWELAATLGENERRARLLFKRPRQVALPGAASSSAEETAPRP